MSYYNNRVKDQILSTPQPSSSGVKYVLMNVGEVANEGWDISVSATPVLTKNFRWDLTANYGIYHNKVVKLAEGVPYLEISNIGGGGAKIQAVEGRPMGDIYVQMPQMNENGDYLVSDKGLYLNQTDLQRVGNINPDGVGGLFSSFSYKNIFLDFSIDFRIGGDVINEMYQYSTASGLTPESLQYRDTEHGGLSYYYPGNNNASGTPQAPVRTERLFIMTALFCRVWWLLRVKKTHASSPPATTTTKLIIGVPSLNNSHTATQYSTIRMSNCAN